MTSSPALPQNASRECPASALSRWLMVFVVLGLIAFSICLLVAGIGTRSPVTIISAVLILFGDYRGTARASGFFAANPFNKILRISLRARNLNAGTLYNQRPFLCDTVFPLGRKP